MELDGAVFDYIERGGGEPVVFVHGALGDCRTWIRQCEALSGRYRAVSYTQRYFGTREWREDWPRFGVRLHADDLIGFIDKLGAGRVHVVAWSYGGHVALTAAAERPDLLRSVLVYEPGFPSYVTDPDDLQAYTDDANLMFAPIFAAVKAGDTVSAMRVLLDASSRRRDYFDSQPAETQRIELDNARTLELLVEQSAAPELGCEELAGIDLPIGIAHGELTRPMFDIVSRAAAGCVLKGWHTTVPGVGHMWPDEEPLAFAELVSDFLS
ncbi:MAG: alpha/beta hydrolase [Gammaproteobacteria bacterium]|nr:alpha/beta hydrolase [Gammaproteobacteria bacterium]